MAFKVGSWTPESLADARARFLPRAVRRGEGYYREGTIIPCESSENGTRYGFIVRNRSSSAYSVKLSYTPRGWKCACTCPERIDCKHAYAALLYLEDHRRQQDGLAPTQTSGAPAPTGFFALFPDRQQFSGPERDFLKHLEDLFSRHDIGFSFFCVFVL
jgi:hypothetical protein